jgi:hypothetical protein
MELKNERIYKGEDYTIGELSINGKFFSNTLEDKVRLLNSYEDKVYGNTAIPIGRYKVILSYSNHFKCTMPEIVNVDFFKGVRIHAGNTKEDTEGCLLVGECKNVKEGFIYNSKNTYKKLFQILQDAVNRNEEIYLTIY